MKDDAVAKEADCECTAVQYSLLDGETTTFMDMQNNSQYAINGEELDGLKDFLYEGLEDIVSLLLDGEVSKLELPASVTLGITEVSPRSTVLSTGFEGQVSEYPDSSERVTVNTRADKYMSSV